MHGQPRPRPARSGQGRGGRRVAAQGRRGLHPRGPRRPPLAAGGPSAPAHRVRHRAGPDVTGRPAARPPARAAGFAQFTSAAGAVDVPSWGRGAAGDPCPGCAGRLRSARRRVRSRSGWVNRVVARAMKTSTV
ncbi:hypothetical protein HFP71_08180 [Streptomyces sp. ARC32]